MRKLFIFGIVLAVSLQFMGCGSRVYSENLEKSTHANIPSLEILKENATQIHSQELKAVAQANSQRKMLRVFPYKLVKFDARMSLDLSGNTKNLKYQWLDEDGHILSKKPLFVYKFDKKGSHEITLKVIDEQQLSAVDKLTIKVI
jgi:hypothetical protein